MKVSVRRIDQHRTKMTEGTHFYRDGTRIIFRYPEAAEFIEGRVPASVEAQDDPERLVDHEVARCRAKRLGRQP